MFSPFPQPPHSPIPTHVVSPRPLTYLSTTASSCPLPSSQSPVDSHRAQDEIVQRGIDSETSDEEEAGIEGAFHSEDDMQEMWPCMDNATTRMDDFEAVEGADMESTGMATSAMRDFE